MSTALRWFAPVALIAPAFPAVLAAQQQQLPPMPVPPENPQTTEKIVLGKILFFEEQLASNRRVACATCHTSPAGGGDRRFARHPGSDNRFVTPDDVHGSPGLRALDSAREYAADARFSFAVQVTGRTSPTAIGAGHFPLLFWDGRASGTFVDPETNQVAIQNGGALESQSLQPLLNTVEMSHAGRTFADLARTLATVTPLALATDLPPDVAAALAARPGYPQLFAAAFGDGAITARRVAFALASYERTLNPNQSPFDQNALTPPQQAGRQLFFGGAGCAACHQPPLFSDRSFRFLGLRPAAEDIGRQAVTNDPGDAGRMKVPSLRNVALRSRWFHNGQAASLDDVVNFYNNPGPPLPGRDPRIRPLGLDPTQRASLVAFLGALTDARVAAGTGPFTRPTLWTERNPPGAELYGNGGPGTGGFVPQLIADLPANVGNGDHRFGVSGALGGAASVLVLGGAETAPDTRVLGAPLHVDLAGAILAPRVLRGTGAGAGFATVPLPLPADAALRGVQLRMQWLVLDGGGPVPLAVSAGARARVF